MIRKNVGIDEHVIIGRGLFEKRRREWMFVTASFRRWQKLPAKGRTKIYILSTNL